MKEASLTRITINSAQFYAYHGVSAEERILGGKYEIDLDMYYDATKAVINDDINSALNYEEAFFLIEEVIAGENHALVETIANEILNHLMEKFRILQTATVRVRKMNAPLHRIVQFIEAEQTMTRSKE